MSSNWNSWWYMWRSWEGNGGTGYVKKYSLNTFSKNENIGKIQHWKKLMLVKETEGPI